MRLTEMNKKRFVGRIVAGVMASAVLLVGGFAAPAQADTGWNTTKKSDTGWNTTR
jgi:hypothetical protein